VDIVHPVCGLVSTAYGTRPEEYRSVFSTDDLPSYARMLWRCVPRWATVRMRSACTTMTAVRNCAGRDHATVMRSYATAARTGGACIEREPSTEIPTVDAPAPPLDTPYDDADVLTLTEFANLFPKTRADLTEHT